MGSRIECGTGDLRNRGMLDDDEVTEIEKVGRKIAECEAALKAGP